MKFYATSYRRCLLDDYKYVQNQLPPPKKENSVFIQQIERIHLKRDALKNKIKNLELWQKRQAGQAHRPLCTIQPVLVLHVGTHVKPSIFTRLFLASLESYCVKKLSTDRYTDPCQSAQKPCCCSSHYIMCLQDTQTVIVGKKKKNTT